MELVLQSLILGFPFQARPVKLNKNEKVNKRGDEATMDGTAKISDQEALDFHSDGKPGKIEIAPTKNLATQRDLSLAYSPGVAVPCP